MTLSEAIRRLKSRHFPGPGVPALLLLTDDSRLPDPVPAMARLPRGAGVVLRRQTASLQAGRVVAAGWRRRQAVLVAGEWRLAAAVGAAGVHLPEALARHGVLAPLLGWRRKRGLLLTMACHSPTALARAWRLGADAALLSPVFPTASHPGAAVLGPLRFRIWVRRARLPVLALGGIGPGTAARLQGSGAAGLAAIGALTP